MISRLHVPAVYKSGHVFGLTREGDLIHSMTPVDTFETARPLRCTPRARVTLMTAGSPSGIADTATATEKRAISKSSYPVRSPIPKTTPAKERPAIPRIVLSLLMRFCSGVRPLTVVCTPPAITAASM